MLLAFTNERILSMKVRVELCWQGHRRQQSRSFCSCPMLRTWSHCSMRQVESNGDHTSTLVQAPVHTYFPFVHVDVAADITFFCPAPGMLLRKSFPADVMSVSQHCLILLMTAAFILPSQVIAEQWQNALQSPERASSETGDLQIHIWTASPVLSVVRKHILSLCIAFENILAGMSCRWQGHSSWP